MGTLRWGALVLALALAVAVVLPATCFGTMSLYAWVQSQSPNGRLVQVNGAIWSDSTNVLNWVYDWGDGAATGYFPIVHRYFQPGIYQITVTGYDDAGHIEQTSFPYEVPELAPSDISLVLATPLDFAGLKCGDSVVVGFNAYDSDGVRLPLDGRTFDYYCVTPDYLDIRTQDSTLVIKAKDLGGADYAWGLAYAYIDGVECDEPLNFIIDKYPGDFTAGKRAYMGFYLPDTFFTASDLSTAEFLYIGDLAYGANLWTTRDKNPNQGNVPFFQALAYAPPAYTWGGNPIGMGDTAIPANGVPKIDQIFHEIGHNFEGANQLFNMAGGPTLFYYETVAEWYVQYDFTKILTEHSSELSQLAVDMLTNMMNQGRAYHLAAYQDYVNGGSQYNFDDFATSDAAVEKIYEYCDTYGWDALRGFQDFFDHGKMPDYAAIIAARGGLTEVNRMTFFLAALSYGFGFDVRPAFVALNFPVNNPLYADLMALYGSGVNPPGRQPGQPDHPVLYQNHPNPVIRSTAVSYYLPRSADVCLDVYNVLGQSVASLDRGERSAGMHTIAFDGSGLSAGVYFCKLTVGDQVDQRKLVIAR
ncbi:MAG TPA: T9SS type A sorting domain-containing protein [bacterium]|nr:T9SS type A sorting domain-containing protein [bacterium]